MNRALATSLCAICAAIAYVAVFSVAIPSNSRGVVTLYGKIQKIIMPGFNVLYPFDKVHVIKTELDTDFKDNVVCKTFDNYYITIPRIYIDNEFVGDNESLMTLYSKYFISDSKVSSKGENKTVPEDGMIFKFIPEVMAEVCNSITAYKTQTNQWTSLFPIIRHMLQVRVPKGINIVGVRLDRPILPHLGYTMSITGMSINTMYVLGKTVLEVIV